ncbi:MAG TPA: TonB family protein [Blastocatellia bacterium]|nr:TonB family protein [Blastocatellia bacterium]
MKKLLSGFSLCLFIIAPAQNSQSSGHQSPQQGEAARLHATVVKLYNEKKYDEALPLARRVVELRETELGKEHELLVASLVNLAMIYKARQDYFNAESAFRRAIKIREKISGEQSPLLHDHLIHLAWVIYANGNSRGAEEIFKRAISIREKAAGAESLQTAISLQNLAAFYQKDSHPAKAVPLWQRIVAIREKNLGENHRDVAEALEQCACAMEQNKQKDQATPLWSRANRIYYGVDRTEVSGGALQGVALKRVQPAYPEAAKSMRISGTVLVRVEIDESGQVTAVRARHYFSGLAGSRPQVDLQTDNT